MQGEVAGNGAAEMRGGKEGDNDDDHSESCGCHV